MHSTRDSAEASASIKFSCNLIEISAMVSMSSSSYANFKSKMS